MLVGKKGAVYGVITLMLCTAIYLNWSYTSGGSDMMVANGTDDEFDILDGIEVIENEELEDIDIIDTDFTTESDEDYFATARLSREKARDEAISILTASIENESLSVEARDEANKQIGVLAENSLIEARIESLVMAKGYEDSVVFMNDDSVNVIVSPPEEGFSAADATKIKDLVAAEAAFEASQIKIVEVS